MLSQSDLITAQDLKFLTPENQKSTAVPSFDIGNISLAKVEQNAILATLEACSGNKSETARRLGITRKTLHKKLKGYGVMP